MCNGAGSDQHQRRQPPMRPDLTRSAHNPKVVGSNPTPATTEALVDRKIGRGFYRSAAVFSRRFNRVFSRLACAITATGTRDTRSRGPTSADSRWRGPDLYL